MKRDMDLVLKILIELNKDTTTNDVVQLDIPGYSDKHISYHVGLLAKAGYIDAIDFRGGDEVEWYPRSLEWEGHEFLDAIQNESIWNEAKEQLKEQFVSIPFQLLVPLVIQIFRQRLGLPTD